MDESVVVTGQKTTLRELRHETKDKMGGIFLITRLLTRLFQDQIKTMLGFTGIEIAKRKDYATYFRGDN